MKIYKWLFRPVYVIDLGDELITINHHLFFSLFLLFHSFAIYLINQSLINRPIFMNITEVFDRFLVVLIVVSSLYPITCLRHYLWYDFFLYGFVAYLYTYIEKNVNLSLSSYQGIYEWFEILIIFIFSLLLLLGCGISYYNLFTNDCIHSKEKKLLFLRHLWPISLILIYVLIGVVVEKHSYFHLHHWIIGYVSLLLLFCSSRMVVFISYFFLTFCIHGLICYQDIPNIWSP